MTTTSRLSSDFDFLVGRWDVEHHRLRRPLTGSDEWNVISGSVAAARTYLDGAVSIDEISFPDHGSSGMSFRLFSPRTGDWSVWWVNSRDGKLQPPVHGRWVHGISRLYGDDTHEGTPVRVTYTWSDVTEDSARWEQAYSADDGRTWETNWVMRLSRTSAEPGDVPHDHLPKATSDFDFLTGTWHVRNRRLRSRLTGSREWDEFENTYVARTHHHGSISVDEGVFPFPTTYTGLTFRAYDVAAGEWVIHWIDGRNPEMDPAPLRGRFTDGVGDFFADEVHDGTPVRVRIRWDVLGPTSVRWEQAFSTDDGKTWEPNWTMDQTRIA